MKHSVLVVSDDESIRSNLSDDVESLGHSTIAVSSAELPQAADRFDLVLLDRVLLDTVPAILSECKQHQSFNSQIAVITPPSLLGNVGEWLERGANDWLLYPCHRLVLKTKLDQYVQIRLADQVPELINMFASCARGPLTSIDGSSLLMQDTEIDQAKYHQQFLSTITKSAEKLFVLLQNFVDYVNVTYYPEGILSRTATTSIGSEIGSIVKDIQKHKKFKSRLQIVPMPDHLPPIKTGWLDLSHVLALLLGNIDVWADEGSDVLLSVSLLSSDNLPQKVQFTVQYTGIPIEERYKDKIFETWAGLPYPKYKRSYEHDLEFPIVKTQIEMLGGEIWVESTPDGSTFHFTLPVAPLA